MYRTVAIHAAVLFFCISDLSIVDPMYQYSLAWFIGLYEASIESSNRACKVRLHTASRLAPSPARTRIILSDLV